VGVQNLQLGYQASIFLGYSDGADDIVILPNSRISQQLVSSVTVVTDGLMICAFLKGNSWDLNPSETTPETCKRTTSPFQIPSISELDIFPPHWGSITPLKKITNRYTPDINRIFREFESSVFISWMQSSGKV